MSELLKGECLHCGQPIEYPAAGAGQTIPCPTCNQPIHLPPANQPAARVSKPPLLEQALREFESDQNFADRLPTREQVGRAWALAKFRKSDVKEPPTHLELVAALKELFPEFKTGRTTYRRSRWK